MSFAKDEKIQYVFELMVRIVRVGRVLGGFVANTVRHE